MSSVVLVTVDPSKRIDTENVPDADPVFVAMDELLTDSWESKSVDEKK